jgi:hypothetical protein
MEVVVQLHIPAVLTGTHWIGSWVGTLRVVLDAVETKKFCHDGNRIRAIQPVAIHTLDFPQSRQEAFPD